jgi:hypothetical protein
MVEEMVDVASKVKLTCGCGAAWEITGLLASSDLTGVIAGWGNKGHNHDEGVEPEVVETRSVAKKDVEDG